MSTPTTAPAPAQTPASDPQAPAAASTASTPPQPQAPAVPQAPQQSTAPQGEPQDVASLPEWAQKLIRDTRAEAADYRTRAQQAAPQQPTPQAPAAPPAAEAPEGDVTRLPKWAQQALADSGAAARRAAVQAAVIQAAPTVGADVARLLDSASFTAAVAQLDPADTAAVTEAIKNAVTAQPYLAAVPQTAPKGGADFSNPGPGAVTAEQFAAMPYAERTELFQTDPDTYRRLANH
ncbi:hypothetical protein [Streptomyces silvensis]|uniref:Uncharacterized protein n=1 Tax=Streptomyces silvensis TaxID=1765722 RepID=A0A0W7X9Z6_9ACTN|nr:hypothetical protein [Streptomyces silvensis]KUF19584.1 hypothetical protein AT728_04215 [Streptomyces silvensis]